MEPEVAPQAAAEFQEEGSRHFREGRWMQACDSFARGLNLLNERPEPDQSLCIALLCNRSAALLKAERCEEAERDAALAVEIDPSLVKPRYRHACALLALGRVQEATVTCDAALAHAPNNSQLEALRRRCDDAQVAAAASPGSEPAVASNVASGAGVSTAECASDSAADTAAAEEAAGGDYVAWCRNTANRLYGEGEYGQACAWYGHAIQALAKEHDAATAEADLARGDDEVENEVDDEVGDADSGMRNASGSDDTGDTSPSDATTPPSSAGLAQPHTEGKGGNESAPRPVDKPLGGDGATMEAAAHERLCTMLSNRAACHLKLGHWAEAARDCERVLRLAPSGAIAVKVGARGSAALMRLGRTTESVELAQAAVRAARPAAEASAARLTALDILSVRELSTMLRDLRRRADKREESVAAAERGTGRHARRARRAPCLVGGAGGAVEGAAGEGRAKCSAAALPIEKGELVAEVEARERAEEWAGDGAAVHDIAKQALDEACAMRDRIGEIARMARDGEWTLVLEHANWLAAEYPQHCILRTLQLDALLALRRHGAATSLIDEQALATPGAPELLHAGACIAFACSGVDAALSELQEIPTDQPGPPPNRYPIATRAPIAPRSQPDRNPHPDRTPIATRATDGQQAAVPNRPLDSHAQQVTGLSLPVQATSAPPTCTDGCSRC